ncbi:RCC1-like G exchanging factor-like protein [Agrilus planipennis]|uniref:RCC1-like G exchanging factor-like protein n=1 Tax=Agrilus planipennis TaxID=224129 RepID=A0A1W4WGP9_AGRPL|nr:RCC1-like G exchanging factor-like protein [Agrilus planipennis]
MCIRKQFFNQIRGYAVKRKYPVNPEDAKKLPVFGYGISKASYNRIFVWGCRETGALAVPQKKEEEKFHKISPIKYPKRLFFAENHEVTNVACGFGFSIFSVNPNNDNSRLYGTGINSDSQIGYHAIRENKPLEIIFSPVAIHLPLKEKKTRINKIAAGRAHTLVLTSEGLFTFGNNAYGQCGRMIITDEDYSNSHYVHKISNVDDTIKDVECGQDHSLILTESGQVYSCGWGADGQTGLGHFNSESRFTRVLGDIANENIVKVSGRSDFVLAINDKGEVFGWGNTEYAQLDTPNDLQQVCNATFIEKCKGLGKIVDIAAGGSFCLILNEDGQVFSWGYGLLGAGPKVQYSKKPVLLPEILFGKNEFQTDSKVIKIKAGIGHAAAISNYGNLYMWGRNRSGCLGMGHDKDQPFPFRVSVSGLVKDVSCGFDHSIALCKPFI